MGTRDGGCRDYGVPQRRQRCILIASRVANLLGCPCHDPPENKKQFAVHKDLPRLRSASRTRTTLCTSHETSSDHSAQTFLHPERCGGRFSLPKKLVLECHKDYSVIRMYTDGFLGPSTPTSTAVTDVTRAVCASFPNRAITLREAAGTNVR